MQSFARFPSIEAGSKPCRLTQCSACKPRTKSPAPTFPVSKGTICACLAAPWFATCVIVAASPLRAARNSRPSCGNVQRKWVGSAETCVGSTATASSPIGSGCCSMPRPLDLEDRLLLAQWRTGVAYFGELLQRHRV